MIMKKNNNIQTATVLFFILLSLFNISCNSMIITKKYAWSPTSSAPVLYPVEIHAAYMRYGYNSALAVPSSAILSNGLAMPGASYGLNDDGKYPLPTGLDILWFSNVDRKFYKAEVDFPVEKIKDLFEEGYINEKGEKITYDKVNVGLIPGGRIIIFLESEERDIELCSYDGKDTLLSLKDFVPDAYWEYKDLDSFIDTLFADKEEDWVKAYEKYGANHGLWDRYRKRYNYDIKVDFEDKNSKQGYSLYRFANSERCTTNAYNPQIYFKNPAALRFFAISWTNGGYEYSGYFYLNEDEVMQIFPEAFKNSGAKGRLEVNIDKYNKGVSISLHVDGKEYLIKQTKIEIDKNKIGSDDAEIIYMNYEHTGRPPYFIGE